jgi:hypothetical protein
LFSPEDLLPTLQAVKTYTHCLQELDEGKLPDWERRSPPEFAKTYWGLDEDSTMRDLVLAVRPFCLPGSRPYTLSVVFLERWNMLSQHTPYGAER